MCTVIYTAQRYKYKHIYTIIITTMMMIAIIITNLKYKYSQNNA